MEVKELSGILSDQQKILNSFLETVKEQQTALIKHNIIVMEETVQKEEKILNSLARIQNKKAGIIERLAKENNLSLSSTSVNELIRQVEPSESIELLKKQQQKVKHLIFEIERINLQNKSLIESGRSFVRETILNLAGENTNQLLDRRI